MAARRPVAAEIGTAGRLLPDHFPTSLPVLSESNLGYPLTYSNALGMLCVLGAILCFPLQGFDQYARRDKLSGRALAGGLF